MAKMFIQILPRRPNLTNSRWSPSKASIAKQTNRKSYNSFSFKCYLKHYFLDRLYKTLTHRTTRAIIPWIELQTPAFRKHFFLILFICTYLNRLQPKFFLSCHQTSIWKPTQVNVQFMLIQFLFVI